MKGKLFLIATILLVTTFKVKSQCRGNTHHKKQVKSAYHHRSDIVDIASSKEDFSTLTTALKIAELVNTLKGDGPFTVFAPTNSAFAKVDKEVLKSLLDPEGKGALQKVLKYHVVAGEFKASDIINAINASGGNYTLKTVSGDRLEASISNGIVILKDENGGKSSVTKTDILASNGVIHVIDSIVIPD